MPAAPSQLAIATILQGRWGLLLVLDANRAAQPLEKEDPDRTGEPIFDYIEIFHNRQRRDTSFGYRTPIELELRDENDTTPLPVSHHDWNPISSDGSPLGLETAASSNPSGSWSWSRQNPVDGLPASRERGP